jgi:putative transposon-encoded protein
MSEFKLRGTEILRREVKAIGGGAMVYLPKKWIGKKVAVVADIE